jgi:hypothetical protein
MDYLPLLPFFVIVVMVGIIHHRYLRRVEAAYARRGLAVPDRPTTPSGLPSGGAWFVFLPHPNDPPDLAEEKRLILKEANGKIGRVMLIGMPLVFAAVAYPVLFGSK